MAADLDLVLALTTFIGVGALLRLGEVRSPAFYVAYDTNNPLD